MAANYISQVTVKNYRSLADVTVDLAPLTVLVGANGSGKSNFVDAISFVNDAIQQLPETALFIRRGFRTLQHKSHLFETASDISIALKLSLNGVPTEYTFTIERESIRPQFNLSAITHEKCVYDTLVVFERSREKWLHLPKGFNLPPMEGRGLALLLFSGFSDIKVIEKFLWDMSFYKLISEEMKRSETLDVSYPLDTEGRNLASALQTFLETSDWASNFKHSLSQIVPDIVDVRVEPRGAFLDIYFEHQNRIKFHLTQESDGTIRILALLLALYQDPPRSLIAIEEPELLIHPGALDTLREVIQEASLRSQIILTTHSPDLIAGFDANQLRVVERTPDGTQIGPVDDVQRQVIEAQLFKASDLLRIDGGLRRASTTS